MASEKSSRKTSRLSFQVQTDWLAQYGESAAQRFRSKIVVRNGCWLWTGTVDRHNQDYPLFFLDSRYHSARRVAWCMRYGSVLEHLTVRTTCGQTLCVNPAHACLLPGSTQTLQVLLTPAQMSEIRLLVAQGWRRTDIAQSFGVELSVILGVLNNAAMDYLALPKVTSSARSQELPHPISRVSERERLVLVKLLKERSQVLNAHERLVLVRRFGLDGQAPQILDALIAPLGVTTRERVRQIERKALRKLQLPTQRRALRAKLDQLAQREDKGEDGYLTDGASYKLNSAINK